MLKRTYLTAALVMLSLAASAPAQEKARGNKTTALPGDALWDLGAWADDYLVVETAYDAKTRQITWTLEARKKVQGRRYQARLTDPDLVELETPRIQLTPVLKEYPKGTRIKATAKMPRKDVMQDVNRVTIAVVNPED